MWCCWQTVSRDSHTYGMQRNTTEGCPRLGVGWTPVETSGDRFQLIMWLRGQEHYISLMHSSLAWESPEMAEPTVGNRGKGCLNIVTMVSDTYIYGPYTSMEPLTWEPQVYSYHTLLSISVWIWLCDAILMLSSWVTAINQRRYLHRFAGF